MNRYVKEAIKITLAGGALAMALSGCSAWDVGKKDGDGRAGRRKNAAVLCSDRACSNAAYVGR